jgi:hypothetical protein
MLRTGQKAGRLISGSEKFPPIVKAIVECSLPCASRGKAPSDGIGKFKKNTLSLLPGNASRDILRFRVFMPAFPLNNWGCRKTNLVLAQAQLTTHKT